MLITRKGARLLERATITIVLHGLLGLDSRLQRNDSRKRKEEWSMINYSV